MCRNIKSLFNFEPPATEEEIRAASLQFVRKVSGFNKPSKANEAAFFAAVDQIAAATTTFLLARDKRATKGPYRRGCQGASTNCSEVSEITGLSPHLFPTVASHLRQASVCCFWTCNPAWMKSVRI